MKIAVYCDLLPGGACRATEEMLRKLKQKHEIEIFHGPKPYPVPSIFSRIFVDLESILYQQFKQKKLAKEIDQRNFDLVFVTHDFHVHSPWILRYLKTPTVFFSQEPTRAFYEKFLQIESNLPALNKLYEYINRFIRKRIEEENVTYATSLITSSLYSTESITRAYGVPSVVAYPGINPEEYHPMKVSKKNQVLIVGNNEPQKNLIFAIEALGLISTKLRPELIIASARKTDMENIIKMAKKMKVKVSFHKGLSQKDMCRLYNESKLTIACAILEPFGMSIIESLACKTAVVAINEAGFRETVNPGVTGILTERSHRKFAQAIEKLLEDDVLRNRMGNAGFDDVNIRFTWDNTVKALETTFYETKKG